MDLCGEIESMKLAICELQRVVVQLKANSICCCPKMFNCEFHRKRIDDSIPIVLEHSIRPSRKEDDEKIAQALENVEKKKESVGNAIEVLSVEEFNEIPMNREENKRIRLAVENKENEWVKTHEKQVEMDSTALQFMKKKSRRERTKNVCDLRYLPFHLSPPRAPPLPLVLNKKVRFEEEFDDGEIIDDEGAEENEEADIDAVDDDAVDEEVFEVFENWELEREVVVEDEVVEKEIEEKEKVEKVEKVERKRKKERKEVEEVKKVEEVKEEEVKLNEYNTLISMSLQELKTICKKKGLKGYSNYSKIKLALFIQGNGEIVEEENEEILNEETLSKMTMVKLKDICKEKNIKGYSTQKSKPKLVSYILERI